MDAITAVSGSGPAYFALLAEAMIEAGILLGLSREISTQLVVQTMLGTAKQLRDEKMHPVELREMVTSPGGTTIAAIRELEIAGVRAAFLNAIQAAMVRSRELAAGDPVDQLRITWPDDGGAASAQLRAARRGARARAASAWSASTVSATGMSSRNCVARLEVGEDLAIAATYAGASRRASAASASATGRGIEPALPASRRSAAAPRLSPRTSSASAAQ